VRARPSSKLGHIANPTSLGAPVQPRSRTANRHCGTGIAPDRDTTRNWRDFDEPCGSLPAVPPGRACAPAATAGFSIPQGEISRETDCLLEGGGFEPPVPRCALIANSAALVAPPDSAVSGGSLNGRLTTPIGGWPATARLMREDRSAQLGRGPENL